MSLTAASSVLLTAEAFLAMGREPRSELVRGRIVEMTPPGFRHGSICSRLIRKLGRYLDDHDIGHLVSNDTGVITQRGPDTVRGPDVAFFLYKRLAKDDEPVGYPAVSPNLVFEVVSPTDRTSDIMEKVAEYLRSDVTVVCLVDPAQREIEVFRDDALLQHLGLEEALMIPEVLPGFELPLRELFS